MKTINAPDLNAPRYRPTRKKVSDRDFFNNFRKKYPQYKDVPTPVLNKIIGKHSELLYKEAVDSRDGAEFPEGMGFIFVGTCNSPKKPGTDFTKSLKYNVKVHHRNFESDNYIAKIFYTNYANTYRFRNRELWQFKGARNFTRLVSKTYPENWKKYLQVENFEMINKYFKKNQVKTYYAEKNKDAALSYNEFEMD